MQNKAIRIMYVLRSKINGAYVRNHYRLVFGTLRQARLFNQAGYARNSRHYSEVVMDVVPFMLIEAPPDFKPAAPPKVNTDLTKILESKL